jgi:putative ABC transport system permease protein
MLILVLNGFLDGMYRQITSYLDHAPGSLVVAQEDVVNLLGATSLLPVGAISRVEAVRRVDEVIPILSQFVILDLHGKKQPTYMVGYDPDMGGGPWEMFAGRQPRTKREVVFDRVLAVRHGLKLGDTVEVMGKDFTVVGLSNGTTSWMTSFFFVRKDAAEDLLLAPGATSYLLVTTSKGANLDDILRRVNNLSDVNALTKRDMAANDIKLFAKVFSAPLKLMVAIAILVGTMIVGLVIYTITVERQREYGVIKAIGGANRVLYKVVLTQALAAALMGTLVGVFMAYGVSQWIMTARQQFLIVLDPFDIGWALLAGLIMALIAALFPAHVVAGLAPAEVFRK